jgi:predicted HicB family RNase H-like nuclease
MARTNIPLQLRLPPDLKAFVAQEAERNGSSQNSEIIRAVRERMERTTAEAD